MSFIVRSLGHNEKIILLIKFHLFFYLISRIPRIILIFIVLVLPPLIIRLFWVWAWGFYCIHSHLLDYVGILYTHRSWCHQQTNDY